MRVSAIMDAVEVSGPAKQLVALVPELELRNVILRPLLFHPAHRPDNPFAELLSEHGIEHDVIQYEGPLDRRLLTGAREAFTRFQPDIVQTHSYRPTAVAAALRVPGVPWRWLAFHHGATTENFKVRLYHELDRALMSFSDHIVVVAPSQVARFAALRKRLTVINNAVLVSPEQASSEHASAALRLPVSSHPKLAVIGRLSREKGVDIFLEAASLVRAPFQAAVIGDGPDQEALQTSASELGLSERVAFIGRMSPVEPAYEWCHLVVIPSRSEGMPNVLLEAIRQGRRVVAADVGNIREIIGGTSLGVVVPAGSPRELADAISAELADPARPADAGDRNRVLARYSLSARADAHLELYTSLLGST